MARIATIITIHTTVTTTTTTTTIMKCKLVNFRYHFFDNNKSPLKQACKQKKSIKKTN